MDLFASITAFKQAYDLAKLIKESHDQSVIKRAAGELSEKITELQFINAELSGLYQMERDIAVKLRDEKNKIEMFIMNSENYELHTTEGCSVVYQSKVLANSIVKPHYLCAHCFSEYKISILQPSTERTKSYGYFVHYCPQCKNEFRMNKTPPLPKVTPREVGGIY